MIQNDSSLDLTDLWWYAHHGSQVAIMDNIVAPKGSYKMEFKKTKNSFFGLSGYIGYMYYADAEEKVKKRVIITFSIPWKRDNRVSVALLDESKLPAGADLYIMLKEEKFQKEMTHFGTSVLQKTTSNSFCL